MTVIVQHLLTRSEKLNVNCRGVEPLQFTAFHPPLYPLGVSGGLPGVLDKWDDTKQLKHYQRIQSAVKHMTALVNDVLFVNQAEFEKLECNPTSLDLVAFFQGLIDERQSTVGEKHCLIFSSSGEGGEFSGDAKLLRQIITNLLDNAKP